MAFDLTLSISLLIIFTFTQINFVRVRFENNFLKKHVAVIGSERKKVPISEVEDIFFFFSDKVRWVKNNHVKNC